MAKRKIKVVELFAGVGGFRLAAEKSSDRYKFIWANQWEPNKKSQHAFDCYTKHFGQSLAHNNEDIAIAKKYIPFNFDLLVGGFPCQDYSVATTKAKGIEGKKGVLWWEINWVIKNRNPKMVLLENVDRLLKSPKSKPGRDFAIMLRCFHDAGYDVQWMVNNGSDFGLSQRRKRIFIFAIKKNIRKKPEIFKDAFPFSISPNTHMDFPITEYKNLLSISRNYDNGKFREYGRMYNGQVETWAYTPTYSGEYNTLSSILLKKTSKQLILAENQLNKMIYYKSHKRILRTRANGESYFYSEGSMKLFDDLSKSSRTMLTSEGTINRSSHLINNNGKIRFLDPIETERLNGFDDNWTLGMPTKMRYFCMGNALIVDLVKNIFDEIKKI